MAGLSHQFILEELMELQSSILKDTVTGKQYRMPGVMAWAN